jgi:hypothetical protein
VREYMIQRLCPHCNSELVRARHADQQPTPLIAQATSPSWRCSVCGGGFTTEQIRDSKRAKSTAIEHARAENVVRLTAEPGGEKCQLLNSSVAVEKLKS